MRWLIAYSCLLASILACRSVGQEKKQIFKAQDNAEFTYTLSQAGWLDLAEPRVLIRINADLSQATTIVWEEEVMHTAVEQDYPKNVPTCQSSTIFLPKGKSKFFIIDEYAGPYQISYTAGAASKGQVVISAQEVAIDQPNPSGYRPVLYVGDHLQSRKAF